jgi:DNA-binding NtrC family response regulator
MPKSVLVVDDDRAMRALLVAVLREAGYHVEDARGGHDGLEKLREAEYDLVLTDLQMPDLPGLELLREGRKLRPGSRWIVLTVDNSVSSAVEAIKSGASDYLTKPLSDPEELIVITQKVLREAESEQTISLLSEELGRQFPPVDMIFLGDRMGRVLDLVREVAPTPASVLITGASGTGKELVARTIHQMSPRRRKPFIAVHCAALSENLLESELFGHERGSFTGAIQTRKGRFELADGGTIFLDEIGDISPIVQVKLLRVLQEREFERAGGERSISIDVRVISATNKDLKAEVQAGRFREDLYYRLNVFPLHLPSLSDRPETILPLADFFAKKFSASFGKKVPVFTQAAQQMLQNYRWPGNIRELQNILERAVILSSGEIDERHLNLEMPTTEARPSKGLLQVNERETIQRVLAEVGGNRRQAAERLGISVRTLHYRLREYGL